MTGSRRTFLQLAAGSVLRLTAGPAATKPLRGIFPIAQSPFTDAGKLDIDSLVKELEFVDRGRVHGFVWPQLASEWASLTEAERLAGAEALGAAAQHLRPALVLGVQAPTTEAAVRYAVHAKKIGADAIISLPPAHQEGARAVIEYYQQVGAATDLPLFAQAVGNMSVDTLIEMYKSIPTFRHVKDEAGQPLLRFHELRERSANQLNIFTGMHGRTMLDEMNRGFAGTMPAASFADLYAQTWDLWHEGKEKEALDLFGRIAMLINEVSTYGTESLKYILQLRGVFKNYRTREPGTDALDDKAKETLRRMLENVKPWFRT